MKKRNIIILSGAMVALTIGIFVACSKDTNKQTSDNMVVPATKVSVVGQTMFTIWEKSDSAYRSNPAAFRKLCNDENYESFLELTNISESLMLLFESQIEKRAYDAVMALGTDWLVGECTSCSDGGLSAFGHNVADLRRMLDTLANYHSPDTVPCFMDYTDSCIVVCEVFKELTGDDLIFCLFNCNMRRAIEAARHNCMAIKPEFGDLF